ncbi:MAG: TonB-dependent receptor [Bryobacteraceae bacterium]
MKRKYEIFQRHNLRRRRLATLLSVCSFLLAAVLVPLAEAQITSVVSGRVLDQQGLALQGVALRLKNKETGRDRYAQSDATGLYRIAGLLAGDYEVTASKAGFSDQPLSGVDVPTNAYVNFDILLSVASVRSEITVNGSAQLDIESSSSGAMITPRQIKDMPLNGQNYLDLLQLVPGVVLNRRAAIGSDRATPILGERAGNSQFLIDGLPNSDQVNGGAAAPFNQESILEFQVITSGYKAEFGHASGGIINAVSRSGSNDFHGAVSLFHRNYNLDSSNLSGRKSPPFVLRWNPNGQFGGPLVKNRAFFFVSAERILESRDLNFQFPSHTPESLILFESPFNQHSKTFDTRLRAKLDQQVGRNWFSQQMNLTNTHVTDFLPLSEAIQLPSTRTNTDARHLMLGVSDIALLGDAEEPFVLNLYGQYRGEPSRIYPSHPPAGAASTLFNIFDTYNSGQITGDQGQVVFGPGFTPFTLDQRYASFGTSVARQNGTHGWKIGWEFQRTMADGTESNNIFNQLFATASDFARFGPVESGVGLITYQGASTPLDGRIHLSDNYDGLYAQDDWKLARSLTLNYGLRWDHDSGFPNKLNFSPRLGLAWSLNPNTVVRASWGIFYDHFREGTARDVPGLGGADISTTRYLSFPRLFYGDPSQVAQIFGLRGTGVPCISNTLTDAQIAQQDPSCMLGGQALPLPLYGIDHLNKIVAPGHAPIPANAALDVSNVQQLSGLSPQQIAAAASLAIARRPGFFSWDPFGHLSTDAIAAVGDDIPVTVDPSFRTPYTSAMQVGLQRQLGRDFVVETNLYHRDMENILGVRNTNLAFVARIPGHTGQLQPGTGNRITLGYGPWYCGTYNGLVVSVKKRFSPKASIDANYTFTKAVDDTVADLVTDQQLNFGLSFASGLNGPLDSFVGVPPVVIDPNSGKTNANRPFIASNGDPVPRTGKFYNGPALTSGPSDLALDHTFLLHGIWDLPWGLSVSGIFRAQSGFHYSASSMTLVDVDGDGLYNALDYAKGRNHFTAPPFVNLDFRLAKLFKIRGRVQLHAYVESFNLFNNTNPAAVETFPNVASAPFGTKLQVLPGREGQGGLRFEF